MSARPPLYDPVNPDRVDTAASRSTPAGVIRAAASVGDRPSRSGGDLPGVLMLLETFHPVVGGGETHARLLAAELARLGMPVTVLTRRRTRDMSRRDEVDGIPVVRVGPAGFTRSGKYLMLATVLPRLIRLRGRYELIYVCGLRVLGVAGVVGSWLLGKRCVLRAEARGEMSGDFARRELEEGTLAERLVGAAAAVRNRVLRRADAFVSISMEIRQEFETFGVSPEWIWEIPNGVDTVRFQPSDSAQRRRLRERLALRSEDRVFVYTGKLIRGKGLPSLLRVWRRLREERNRAHAHLVLVGGGELQALSQEAELRAYVRDNGLDDAVTFTGYVSNVDQYLKAADVFVLPSESEAFPLSLLEAMACGLVVIGTRTGGIAEIVRDGENGLLIPVGDDRALLDALRFASEDSDESRRLGSQAREDVVADYGIARVAEEHRRRFRGLIERNGP